MSNISMSIRCAGQYPDSHTGVQDEDREEGPSEPRQRARTIKWLGYVSLGLMTLDEAARALEISPATLDRRKRDLLRDDRQDTDDLRKLELARKQQERPGSRN